MFSPTKLFFFTIFSSCFPQSAEYFFLQFQFLSFNFIFDKLFSIHFVCFCGMYASLRLNLYFFPFVNIFSLNLFLGRSAERRSLEFLKLQPSLSKGPRRVTNAFLIELKCFLRSSAKRTEGYYCSLLDLGAFVMADFV